jgi:hypothetical protein
LNLKLEISPLREILWSIFCARKNLPEECRATTRRPGMVMATGGIMGRKGQSGFRRRLIITPAGATRTSVGSDRAMSLATMTQGKSINRFLKAMRNSDLI